MYTMHIFLPRPKQVAEKREQRETPDWLSMTEQTISPSFACLELKKISYTHLDMVVSSLMRK